MHECHAVCLSVIGQIASRERAYHDVFEGRSLRLKHVGECLLHNGLSADPVGLAWQASSFEKDRND